MNGEGKPALVVADRTTWSMSSGGPMYEGHKISHRTIRFSRFDSAVGTRRTEFCVSIIRRRFALYKSGKRRSTAGAG